MRPVRDNDAERSAIHTLSHTAYRSLLAETARFELHAESWNVPGSNARAPAEPNYRHVMAQPTRSDGAQRHPGKVAVMYHVIDEAGDVNRLWV